MAKFIAPTGYVELDNDGQYSLDRKSTRSREMINPKEDLEFYFKKYISPKYGLNNINVANCASFMKDLDMNWSKLTPDLKSKVVDILVDGIFTKSSNDFDFKNNLLKKLSSKQTEEPDISPPSKPFFTKSSFGKNKQNNTKLMELLIIIAGTIMLGMIIYLVEKV